MDIEFTKKNNVLIVSVNGEIDHHSSETIRNKIDSYITATSVKNVVFDFSKVTFMDSSGIGMLMGRYRNVKRIDGNVWLVSVSENVKRILEMSGVLGYIPILNDISEVL